MHMFCSTISQKLQSLRADLDLELWLMLLQLLSEYLQDPAVRGWQLAAGSWQLAAGSWQVLGCWQLNVNYTRGRNMYWWVLAANNTQCKRHFSVNNNNNKRFY